MPTRNGTINRGDKEALLGAIYKKFLLPLKFYFDVMYGKFNCPSVPIGVKYIWVDNKRLKIETSKF